MNVLIILVPVSLVLAVLALIFFLWTLRSGQYDDLEGDAYRVLLNDEKASENDIDKKEDEDKSQ